MAGAAEGSGLTVTANGAEIAPTPHALVPCTVILPEVAEFEKSTIIVIVPVLVPPTMVAPVGKVQLYPVAFGMATMEYVTPV